ncbi:DctP family TRAP transporter solute-binding subunit [Sphaerochaeta sp. PS]|uniref:TRAP transporter substrate-binding protein n=1 Tax=Sphaerochaeta sp. PS TaxID=3076336 RepID=UPI0028A3E57B|nr:DctP family TRAP transporter solute-binding subunit [Sphaerochaeta sp. PS]MDT4762247.1 DctP family TRAP transporter solute-binding subunit [Sphaerochaeta sp. PS]
MKKPLLVLALVVVASLLFFGCAKKDSAAASTAGTMPAATASSVAVAPSSSAVEKAAVSIKKEVRTVKPDYTIRFAYYDAATWPNISKTPLPEHAYALVFKSIVESNSNGKIAVELYPGNALGDTKATMEMAMSGGIEMVTATGTASSIMPELQVIFLPYVFKSDEIAWDFFDNSDLWKEMTADFQKKSNLKMLSVGQNGTRHFTNNKRPIHTPADMKGLKFRVMQSPIYVKMVEAMGASATPLASGEIYTACQTGVVDGQENPIWNIAANKWNEVQKYITLDGHTWSENFVMMNVDFWNSLPANYQHIITIAAYHAQNADRAAEALASRVLDFESVRNSMEVYVPTAAELEAFKTAAAPTYDWLRGEVGDSIVDRFLAEVKKSEVKFGW